MAPSGLRRNRVCGPEDSASETGEAPRDRSGPNAVGQGPSTPIRPRILRCDRQPTVSHDATVAFGLARFAGAAYPRRGPRLHIMDSVAHVAPTGIQFL